MSVKAGKISIARRSGRLLAAAACGFAVSVCLPPVLMAGAPGFYGEVYITTPTASENVAGLVLISVSAYETGTGSGIAGITVGIDNVGICANKGSMTYKSGGGQTAGDPAIYEYTWDTSVEGPGSRDICAEATDIDDDATLQSATVNVTVNSPPGPPSLLEPAHNATGVDIYTVFRTSASDVDDDNLRYKIEIDIVSDFSSNPIPFIFDQTMLDQSGWSGQDRDNGTAYSSGPVTVAKTTGTLVTPLGLYTTYYWRAGVLDYAGSDNYVQSTATNTFVTRGPKFYASSSTSADWPVDGKPEIAVGQDNGGVGHMQLVSLGSGKVMALYSDSTNVSYKIFDASVWGSELTAVTNALDAASAAQGNQFHYFSAVSDNANAVHLVYIDTANDIKYSSYTAAATPVWSAPGLIAAGTLANPSLSYDSENNAIYAFWIDVNTIKYSSRTVTSAAAAWSGAETLAADCNAPGYLGSSSSSPLRIGILWRENYETSYVVKYSTLTLVPAPENPRVDSVFISSIAMKWDSMTSNKGYVVDASTRSDFTGTIHSSITADGNAAALTVFETALSTNTRYYFRVGSLWNSGATSYAASIVSTVTLAAQPGVPAVFTEVFFASVTVSWPDNGNPAYTEYFLWVSTAADFTGTIYYPAGGAQWFTGASAVFIDFCAGRTYYFRAKARNLNNIETSTTELGNTTTATSAFIDCGLRFRDGTGTTITGAGQNISECPAELKLKIQKGNDTYGIATVDEGDPKASKLKIQTPDGPKCIRRYP